MNRRQFTKLLAGAGLLLAGCRAGAAPSSSTPERKDSMQTTTQTYTRTTPIETVRNDPVFGDYGRLIFPVERSYYSGDTLEQLHLTYYNNIDPDETVDICNTLRQRAADGQTIFYDIYTEDEQAADPDKADTGLFYFKGNPGAKFSICNAGGAFAYVGAMQDSFPHALELSRKEYNAFALIYRPGAQTACEDLARAIAFVFTHAEELEVDTSGYSLWGGSAGARMAAWLGSYGTASFGEQAYPQPGAVIMQYTGLGEVYGNEPPTYACVGDRDYIADERVMRWRIETTFKAFKSHLALADLADQCVEMIRLSVMTRLIFCAWVCRACHHLELQACPRQHTSLLRVASIFAGLGICFEAMVLGIPVTQLMTLLIDRHAYYESRKDRVNFQEALSNMGHPLG